MSPGKNDSLALFIVIRSHQASYTDPIFVRAGELVKTSPTEDQWAENANWVFIWSTDMRGKSGWLPKECLKFRHQSWYALYDYNALELSVAVDDIVEAQSEISGWLWCTN